MIFDSVYDTYRGVITYIRVVDGAITPRERIKMMSTGATHELLEVGIVSPEPKPSIGLGVGEVGYLITGVKDVRLSKVGDTVTSRATGPREPLTGYREPRPMVYSGLYPVDGSEYPELREALDKLQLNDAALTYEPETSAALGFGFRCGFLGLLHLEITRDRLEREAGLDLISTAPNVVYRVIKDDGTEMTVTNPSDWPRARSRRSSSRSSRSRSWRRRSSSARSWSCARAGAASSAGWTTCRRPASSCATRCRSPRSSSTSSTR